MIDIDKIWKELTGNFSVLESKEKKEMITRCAPVIISVYEEFGYQFDGIENARDIVESLS